MEIVYVYQRKRREFGRQIILQDRPPQLMDDCSPDPSYMRNYAEKNPCVTEVQCVPEMSEHEINTDSLVLHDQGIMHTEGGWPKDVDPTDVEHTIRYRKKIEKDDEYMRAVKTMGDVMEHCIKQNNAIDIYEEYFSGETGDPIAVDPPFAKTVNVYRDPNPVKRTCTSLSWYPDEGHKLAIAYSNLQFQKTPSNMAIDSYIWDVENPNVPDQVITPSSPLVCLKYNPKDPHVLVGGSYNGLVAYWDTRKGSYPVDSSIIAKSHRDPVYNIAWIQSKTGSEFFSTSTDGQVLWWDIRKLAEPTESLLLDPEKNGVVVGGTVLDFETTMPTKFMVGSESGSIFMCNKKAKTAGDRISHTYLGHHGPIYALQRNPFFLKNFLTVGDWTAKIWIEDIRTPILSTRYHTSYLTDASWSPTRPSVFFTSKADGTLDAWDILFKQNDPTLSVQVCNSAIHCLKVQEHGRMIACGARDGSTTVLTLSDGLTKGGTEEKAAVGAMLERESKREKTLESAAREKRLKAQQQAGAAAPGGPGQKRPGSSVPQPPKAKGGDAGAEAMEEAIQAAETDFFTFTTDEPPM